MTLVQTRFQVAANGQWTVDATRTECAKCRLRFSLWCRRHHCRCCGEVFCDSCTAYRSADIPGLSQFAGTPLRACETCFYGGLFFVLASLVEGQYHIQFFGSHCEAKRAFDNQWKTLYVPKAIVSGRDVTVCAVGGTVPCQKRLIARKAVEAATAMRSRYSGGVINAAPRAVGAEPLDPQAPSTLRHVPDYSNVANSATEAHLLQLVRTQTNALNVLRKELTAVNKALVDARDAAAAARDSDGNAATGDAEARTCIVCCEEYDHRNRKPVVCSGCGNNVCLTCWAKVRDCPYARCARPLQPTINRALLSFCRHDN